MSISEIIKAAQEIQELKRMREELEQTIAGLEDNIKQAMTEEQLIAGPYKISYKSVTSARLDTSALKKELPDVVARYTKTTTCKRFTIN